MRVTGYHVTHLLNLQKIRFEGLKGYRFKTSEEISSSFTPLKEGRIYRNGWIFAYPFFEEALNAVECGWFEPDPKILKIEGEGFEFFHEMDNDLQLAIWAKTASWTLIK